MLSKTAVVLGGAECVWDDHKKLIEFHTPELTVCINDIGVVWPHKFDIWVSHHADKLTEWAYKRSKTNLPPATELWTGPVKARNSLMEIQQHRQRGGSSGLLATCVALDKAQKVVLCGVPMLPTMRHWHNDKGGVPWTECTHYLKHWEELMPNLLSKRVRSMSGWTRDRLGLPTKEWLDDPA